ncbi:MAG: SDR family oxidoreductase [Streptosporangiaceae bacterium]
MTGAGSRQVAGKVVAITGAGRGIGAATARLLAAQGARVVLGSRGEEDLAVTADAIAASGGDVAYQATDITQPQQVSALVDLATQRFGRLDVLASIAGVAINAPLHSGELDDWNRMIDINLRGVLHGIAAALPIFRAQGSGQFITVASTAAYKWVPGQAVYAATKTAVRALCEVMRQELAPEGLRCTLISPGFTNTEFISSTRDPDELAALTARRDAMAMPPQAVAETIAFAIAQPDSVDIGEVIVRPTVQP